MNKDLIRFYIENNFPYLQQLTIYFITILKINTNKFGAYYIMFVSLLGDNNRHQFI